MCVQHIGVNRSPQKSDAWGGVAAMDAPLAFLRLIIQPYSCTFHLIKIPFVSALVLAQHLRACIWLLSLLGARLSYGLLPAKSLWPHCVS